MFGSKNHQCVCLSLSHVQLFEIPWTVVCQAPTSMRFYRQEYWSGLPFPSPGDLPGQWTEPRSPTLQAESLPHEPPEGIIYTCSLLLHASFLANFISPTVRKR